MLGEEKSVLRGHQDRASGMRPPSGGGRGQARVLAVLRLKRRAQETHAPQTAQTLSELLTEHPGEDSLRNRVHHLR